MNFRRRLETTMNRVRIRLTVPSSDPDPAARRFRSSIEIFGSLLGARARGQKRYFFFAALYWWLFPSLFSGAGSPAKKKKGPARRERSVRMRAAGQGRHAM